MKTRLARAKKEGQDAQVKRIAARIKELEKVAGERREAVANPGALAIDNPTLIRQSYLRTLSRNPTPEEMERCEQFLASSENPVAGARGLLWTLINTKEFIVNH